MLSVLHSLIGEHRRGNQLSCLFFRRDRVGIGKMRVVGSPAPAPMGKQLTDLRQSLTQYDRLTCSGVASKLHKTYA